MKNLQKHIKGISAGLLFAAGICTIIWGTNIKVQFGVGCLCWCIAVAILVLIAKQKNQEESQEFEVSAKEILLDIANKQDESEYFGFYDIGRINLLRAKMTKRHKKQETGFIVFSVVLFIISIISFV